MNMQGLNAVRVEEVIICLYKWLNPNTAIDEAIYNGMMSQPFLYLCLCAQKQGRGSLSAVDEGGAGA